MKYIILLSLICFSSLSYGQTKDELSHWVAELQQKKITADDFLDLILGTESLEKISQLGTIRQVSSSDQLQGRILILENRLDSLIKELRPAAPPDSGWTNTCCAPPDSTVYRAHGDLHAAAGIRMKVASVLVDSLLKVIEQLKADKEELQWELAQERRGIDPGMDQGTDTSVRVIHVGSMKKP